MCTVVQTTFMARSAMRSRFEAGWCPGPPDGLRVAQKLEDDEERFEGRQVDRVRSQCSALIAAELTG